MRRLWSTRAYTDAGVVRAYVKRLRRKLGESAADPVYIFNEPRVGYRLGAGQGGSGQARGGRRSCVNGAVGARARHGTGLQRPARTCRADASRRVRNGARLPLRL